MKARYGLTVLAVALIGTTGMIAPASAESIGFEDLAAPGCCSSLPDPYHGLSWAGSNGSFSWVIGETSANVFLGTQAHSGTNYAWTNGLSDLSISSAGSFDFNSMWARGGPPGYEFSPTIHGFNGASEIYTQTFALTSDYQLYTFNFIGITDLTISNGITNILIDDITINATPVPEPETYAMLMAGLGLLGAVARRRKSAAA
jgi:PEP-CTERM motif